MCETIALHLQLVRFRVRLVSLLVLLGWASQIADATTEKGRRCGDVMIDEGWRLESKPFDFFAHERSFPSLREAGA